MDELHDDMSGVSDVPSSSRFHERVRGFLNGKYYLLTKKRGGGNHIDRNVWTRDC